MRVLRSVFLAALAAAAPPLSTTAADDLNTERARVLTEAGPVKDLTGDQKIVLGPLEDDVGLVFVREHREPGAKSLRLHFTVENPATACGWALAVKDSSGTEVWSASAADGAAFWSDEVTGQRARIEVFSTRPANPVRIAIDRVAVRNDEVEPLSITGRRNDLKSIRGQDPWIVERGRSVARLRFVADNGKSYACTGFLVTRELLLTNQHCIATESERDSAQVDFDYDTDRLAKRALRLKAIVSTSVPLDYTLLRLKEPVDRTPLRLETTRPPDREAMLVIQHPGGEPKQVSIRDCVVDGPAVRGRSGPDGGADPDSDFGHQCDTMTGSSGSPVFRFGSRTVVGLHHLAYDAASLFNRAVHIDRVLADLPPESRAEVEAGQPPRVP
jgi:hypothetical protein